MTYAAVSQANASNGAELWRWRNREVTTTEEQIKLAWWQLPAWIRPYIPDGAEKFTWALSQEFTAQCGCGYSDATWESHLCRYFLKHNPNAATGRNYSVGISIIKYCEGCGFRGGPTD